MPTSIKLENLILLNVVCMQSVNMGPQQKNYHAWEVTTNGNQRKESPVNL
jgi:hypothetical protein